MASNVHVTAARRNAMLDNLLANLNSGKLRIYSGTQPANADTGLSGNTLLAELTFNATAFGAAASGSATANAITSDSDADATGTAAWFRALKSDGTTVVLDGSVGTSGADLNINTTSIVQHGLVSASSMVVSMSA